MTATASGLQHRAEQLAATLPPLLVAAERVATTVAQGVHGRRRVGQGETFWQFRRYEFGDSAQRIDWRQSGKSDPVYIRETEWEAAQTVWLWADRSRSMDFGSRDISSTKAERAALLALALAALLIRGGERIALVDSTMAPTTGTIALHRLAALLSRPPSATPSLPPFRPLPRYGQIVLIGDFLTPLPKIEDTLRQFGETGVNGHVVQVLDPAERDFPFSGRIRFEGFEEEGDILIRRSQALRQDYRGALEQHVNGLTRIVQSMGWTLSRHFTDHSPEAALLTLYAALSVRPGG
ncbi:MAG: DUF58 domain-containing protein [Alphaproteobacteria bacterium]|nr:DUF58 domain-containing protein [Alphaproteobacteria bacterium]